MDVLPPLAIHGADRPSPAEVDTAIGDVQARMERLWDVEPIAYRHQNGGDYDDDLVLHDRLRAGETGIAVHTQGP